MGVPLVWLYLNPSRTLPFLARADVTLLGVGLFSLWFGVYFLLSSIIGPKVCLTLLGGGISGESDMSDF